MNKRTFILSVIAGTLSSGPVIATAADATQTQTQTKTQNQMTVYGSQLMTRQERNEYRTKMRSMKTQQEREAYRLEHHKQMQERAKARGVTLPDMPPPAAGKDMGPGGRGMSPGGSMGGRMGSGGMDSGGSR
ncbi:hypothetical protein CAP31_07885 [Sulfuriferula sp. AH1]|nr:hypothetical protein CAP31_07885 [Sulfuriferula sp. AH1]